MGLNCAAFVIAEKLKGWRLPSCYIILGICQDHWSNCHIYAPNCYTEPWVAQNCPATCGCQGSRKKRETHESFKANKENQINKSTGRNFQSYKPFLIKSLKFVYCFADGKNGCQTASYK